ncbi:WAP four-disulfide core domain protein 3-like isoform X2 [Eublepharis macularius]|uniref:WAP four-disulfide core domain protein 3-like isoform X2 n=1 Tax=Eublepharis macularius TaxID=481883 RepID=A0AA97JHJ0_EUBMA|nr:WAP four-disulfide core domain protein 3-like isoform X2 [Eublepharis macularius]
MQPTRPCLVMLLTLWAQQASVSSQESHGLPYRCTLPPEMGPCKMKIRRFYYDPAQGGCLTFTYGGCQGNSNNFETKEECEEACGEIGPDKPGRCPTPEGPGTCVHGCSSDYSCDGIQKCCSNGCGQVCIDPVFPGKPGRCPTLKGAGICVEDCSSDDSCDGSQKCCSNGCGHVCLDPVFPEKPGRCPTPEGPGICLHGCSSDYSCCGRQKCCSNGCGQVCMDPIFPERPGRCPRAPPGTITVCLAKCDTDWECPSPQKCCSWGCKRDCFDPVKTG